MKCFIWNYRIDFFLKKQKQSFKRVFWKIAGILKNNSQLLIIWAESMENTSVDF